MHHGLFLCTAFLRCVFDILYRVESIGRIYFSWRSSVHLPKVVRKIDLAIYITNAYFI